MANASQTEEGCPSLFGEHGAYSSEERTRLLYRLPARFRHILHIIVTDIAIDTATDIATDIATAPR
jgi:hypothetical protein